MTCGGPLESIVIHCEILYLSKDQASLAFVRSCSKNLLKSLDSASCGGLSIAMDAPMVDPILGTVAAPRAWRWQCRHCFLRIPCSTFLVDFFLCTWFASQLPSAFIALEFCWPKAPAAKAGWHHWWLANPRCHSYRMDLDSILMYPTTNIRTRYLCTRNFLESNPKQKFLRLMFVCVCFTCV